MGRRGGAAHGRDRPRASVLLGSIRTHRRIGAPVARRALLIASQTFGLTGCDADVALMQRLLGERGFDPIATLTGKDASRRGIVDAFEALIADTAGDDA